MEQGSVRFPHKYIRRVRKDGRWVYVYADDSSDSFAKLTADTQEHKIVIAQGNPTSILVNKDSLIVYGPYQVLGRNLFINKNPDKSYWGVARNLSFNVPPVYLYTEGHLKQARSKKCAKLLKADRAMDLLDQDAHNFMDSFLPIDRQYGLAIWLNNNTKIRIGAHESAASVNAKERQQIINQAKQEGWSDKDKLSAMEGAKRQTFGLLTLRVGHVSLDPKNRVASFNFSGKGGKMVTGDNVSVKLPNTPFFVLQEMLRGRSPTDKLLPDVVYKKVWRLYKQYGVTPHIVRSNFADHKVREIIDSFKRSEAESHTVALQRLNRIIESNVSSKLGHSRQMTERSYISPTTQNALAEIRRRLAQSREIQMESAASYEDHTRCLLESILWLEIGAPNIVV